MEYLLIIVGGLCAFFGYKITLFRLLVCESDAIMCVDFGINPAEMCSKRTCILFLFLGKRIDKFNYNFKMDNFIILMDYLTTRQVSGSAGKKM